MEIRDVIGQLRLDYLELQRKIDTVRLDVHVLWTAMYGPEPRYVVSRETREVDHGTDTTQPPLPGL